MRTDSTQNSARWFSHLPPGLVTRRLSELSEGEVAILAGIDSSMNLSMGASLLVGGFLSGLEVRLVRISPAQTYIVEVEENTYGLSKQQACNLLVAAIGLT